MTLYVVEMIRYGDREKHSYVIGVFDNHDLATKAGDVHTVWRGGKYVPVITRHELNSGPSDEELNYYQQCSEVDSVLCNLNGCSTNKLQD